MTTNEQLAELRQKQEELQRLQQEITSREPILKAAYVQEIKDHCEQSGWAIAEICAMLKSEKRRGTVTKIWKKKDDEARVYKGRALPTWMKQDMLDRGMDPESKDDRNAYRDEYMEEAA